MCRASTGVQRRCVHQPTQVRRRPRHARRARGTAVAAAQPGARRGRWRNRRVCQSDRAPVPRRPGRIAKEGGTPAIIESIRAGVAFQLKQAVGVETIKRHEESYWKRAVATWSANPAVQVLGNIHSERLSILSFIVKRPNGNYLHHNFVVALLSDLFGIQSRGGCSCVGPYGHLLLGIDIERSHEFEHEIAHGCEGIKPGWTRLSFNYFISEAVFQYLVDAVDLVAAERMEAATRLPLQSSDRAVAPSRRADRAAVASLTTLVRPDHRRAAATAPGLRAGPRDSPRRISRNSPTTDVCRTGMDQTNPHPGGLSAEFEHLRWFDLPEESLTP